MFAPGVRHPSPDLGRTVPFVLAACTIAAMLAAWAFVTPSRLRDEHFEPAITAIRPETMRSVAYLVPGRDRDTLYVRKAEGGTARIVDTFPAVSYANLHARGLAAPTGDRVAVLSVLDPARASATLTIVDMAGNRVDAAAALDYLSPLAWSPDGRLVAGVASRPSQEGTGSSTDVVVVDASSGESSVSAHFDAAFQVVPVGYSLDRERLFVVVLDQSGSVLWTVRNGRAQKTAVLSTGRTSYWSLSPDGARLAFVDIVPAGERRYAGRTLLIATGSVSDSASSANELGAAWMPGAQLPAFGGPGGSVRLNPPSSEGDYVVPASWSPDGTMLVATIYSASSDRSGQLDESVELATTTSRTPLSSEPGAHFVGWMRTIE